MGHTADKIAEAKMVDSFSLAPLLRDGYAMIAPAGDADGPIDALVPWETANFFVQACTAIAGGTVYCEYVRGGHGHIRCRGRRAAMEQLAEKVEA